MKKINKEIKYRNKDIIKGKEEEEKKENMNRETIGFKKKEKGTGKIIRETKKGKDKRKNEKSKRKDKEKMKRNRKGTK